MNVYISACREKSRNTRGTRFCRGIVKRRPSLEEATLVKQNLVTSLWETATRVEGEQAGKKDELNFKWENWKLGLKKHTEKTRLQLLTKNILKHNIDHVKGIPMNAK